MNLQFRSRVSLLAMVGVLSACAAAPPPQPTPTPVPPTPVRAAPAPPDLSEIPMPDAVHIVAQAGSLAQLRERVDALTGRSQALRTEVDRIISTNAGGVDDGIDPDGPVFFLNVGTQGGPDVDVVAFSSFAPEALERRVGQRFTLAPAPGFPAHIHWVRAVNRDDSFAGTGGVRCVHAPTPRQGAHLLACANSSEGLQTALPYLHRTLARREVPATRIVVEIPSYALQHYWAERPLRDIASSRRDFEQELTRHTDPLLQNATIADNVAVLVRGWLDATEQLFARGRAASLTAELEEQRVLLRARYEVQEPRAELLRGYLQLVRSDNPVPPAMLQSLPADGMLYAAGSIDTRPLRTFTQAIANILPEAAAHPPRDVRVTAADRRALQAALPVLAALDRSRIAVGVGADAAGNPWSVAIATSDTITPAQWTTHVQNLVALVRTPLARRLLQQSSNMSLPDMPAPRPARGPNIPAGSILLQIPATLPTASTPPSLGRGIARRPPARPANTTRPVLVAPTDRGLLVVSSSDPIALFQTLRTSTTPGVNPQYFATEGNPATLTFIPSGLPAFVQSVGGSSAADVVRSVLRPLGAAAQTPLALRYRSEDSDAVGAMQLELEVPTAPLATLLPVLLR